MHPLYLLLLLISSICPAAASTGEHHWSYDEKSGPSTWGGLCAEGDNQSPIDIDPKTVEYDANLASNTLRFHGYRDLSPAPGWEIINNGHSVQVNLPEGHSISGGPLEGKYNTDQFHMHWGSSNNKGSEHTEHGKRYPLEIHIVHHSDKYSSSKAAKMTAGLAVLGVFVELTNEDNSNLEPLIDALSSVVKEGDSARMQPFLLESLIPDIDAPAYFTYAGSLTTPDCYETVTWMVFQKKLSISQAQMASLRALMGSSGSPLADNFRPTQQLNGRIVRTNRPLQTRPSSHNQLHHH